MNTKSAELRRRAEDIVGHALEGSGDDYMRRIVHELRVHETELEIQNEELRRTQTELEESRKKFSDLYEFAPVGYFTLNTQGVITDVNLTGAEMLGRERRYLINRPFRLLLSQPFRLRIDDFFMDMMKSQSLQVLEVQIKRAEGEPLHVRMEGRVERLEDRAPEGFWIVMTDITDRKKAHDEVEKLNAELESRVQQRTTDLMAANREMEAFCYSVSHDLRAPLRSIDGFAQILQQESGDKFNEVESTYFQRIRNASQHMAQLINDLLHLFQVTRGSMRDEVVDLTEICQRISNDLTSTDSGRSVQFQIETGLKTAGDKHLIEIMLRNLLENAWKFLKNRDKAKIQVGCLRKDEPPTFYIRDNGPGFDMTYVSKLFNPFQRLHKKEDFPGTGIGLATVKRIIERHGGRIWVEARPDRGARFYFTLPKAPIKQQEQPHTFCR